MKVQSSGLKVWIDQDECTGDGICTECSPDVFVMKDDGLAYVKEGDRVFDGSDADHPAGGRGLASIPAGQEDAVFEAAEVCPGSCIYVEEAT